MTSGLQANHAVTIALNNPGFVRRQWVQEAADEVTSIQLAPFVPFRKVFQPWLPALSAHSRSIALQCLYIGITDSLNVWCPSWY
jgi:hypothetical protein